MPRELSKEELEKIDRDVKELEDHGVDL